MNLSLPEESERILMSEKNITMKNLPESENGRLIEAEWHFGPEGVLYRASLPAGAEGTLILPCERNEIRVVRGEEGIAGCHSADGRLAMDLRSGQYEFIIAIKNEEAKP